MSYIEVNGRGPIRVVPLPSNFPSLEEAVSQICEEIDHWFDSSTMRPDEQFVFANFFHSKILELNHLYLNNEIVEILNDRTNKLIEKIFIAMDTPGLPFRAKEFLARIIEISQTILNGISEYNPWSDDQQNLEFSKLLLFEIDELKQFMHKSTSIDLSQPQHPVVATLPPAHIEFI